MKITYLYHSGFSVELEECVLLFDYYKGKLPVWEKNKALYVFASHKHQDHFNLRIFDLAKQYEKIHFFLGSDIKLNGKYLERNGIPSSLKEKMTNTGKCKVLESNGIWLRTLRSTDEGVAFIVRVEGRTIYHAGDLNWWHWEGEPYPFNENMEKDYKREIDSMKGLSLDVAFVVLDPRLEAAYGWGMDYFLEQVGAGYVFPMHMWEKYEMISQYKKTGIGNAHREQIMNIRKAGQEFAGCLARCPRESNTPLQATGYQICSAAEQRGI